MQGSVTIEIQNNIGTIEFFHPQSNSLPSKILSKLANTISEAGTNDKIKVIILKSKGDRTFCAGASFDELSNINNFSDGKKFFYGICKCY
jgi:methylglutaconyl-CoA hydratase